MAACWILVGIIIITIAVAMMASMKIGKKISKKISDPLGELGIRLETFAAGDLTSPFPEINTGDEVEEMGKNAVHMADNLSAIIHDMDTILGKMSGGDYTAKSEVPDRYTNDFQKMYQSMRTLKSQMTKTLTSIGEASEQVQAASGIWQMHHRILRRGQQNRLAQYRNFMQQSAILLPQWEKVWRAQTNPI